MYTHYVFVPQSFIIVRLEIISTSLVINHLISGLDCLYIRIFTASEKRKHETQK